MQLILYSCFGIMCYHSLLFPPVDLSKMSHHLLFVRLTPTGDIVFHGCITFSGCPLLCRSRAYLSYVLCWLCLITELCPTLCDPMDYSPTGSSVHGDSPGKKYWSGLPCPPPGDLPNPGTEPRSLELQVDSLPAEPPEKPYLGYKA